jgi:hypothetical protein
LKVIYNVGTFKVQKIEKLINENIEWEGYIRLVKPNSQ